MCLVNNFDTPTPVTTDFGTATITIHEREPRAFGIGLATLNTCAILAAIIEAQDRGVPLDSKFSISEFCKQCGSLVNMTVVPTEYKYI